MGLCCCNRDSRQMCALYYLSYGKYLPQKYRNSFMWVVTECSKIVKQICAVKQYGKS